MGGSVHAITTNAGILDLLAWGAVQAGRWGVQRQRAHAADLEAGFEPVILLKLKPWLRSGFTIGSSDANPNDNRHRAFPDPAGTASLRALSLLQQTLSVR